MYAERIEVDCPHCNSAFESKTRLLDHMAEVHRTITSKTVSTSVHAESNQLPLVPKLIPSTTFPSPASQVACGTPVCSEVAAAETSGASTAARNEIVITRRNPHDRQLSKTAVEDNVQPPSFIGRETSATTMHNPDVDHDTANAPILVHAARVATANVVGKNMYGKGESVCNKSLAGKDCRIGRMDEVTSKEYALKSNIKTSRTVHRPIMTTADTDMSQREKKTNQTLQKKSGTGSRENSTVQDESGTQVSPKPTRKRTITAAGAAAVADASKGKAKPRNHRAPNRMEPDLDPRRLPLIFGEKIYYAFVYDGEGPSAPPYPIHPCFAPVNPQCYAPLNEILTNPKEDPALQLGLGFEVWASKISSLICFAAGQNLLTAL